MSYGDSNYSTSSSGFNFKYEKPKMTINDFLKELRKCKGFGLTAMGCIRDKCKRCPITAVAAMKGIKAKSKDAYNVGKDNLFLEYNDISNIIYAADNGTIDKNKKLLRKRMLKALQLS